MHSFQEGNVSCKCDYFISSIKFDLWFGSPLITVNCVFVFFFVICVDLFGTRCKSTTRKLPPYEGRIK